MFYLMILVAFYVMAGFTFAWIVGIVAREEISIGTGVGIVLLSGILAFASDAAVGQLLEPGLVRSVLFSVLTWFWLAAAARWLGHLPWKLSMIAALVFSVVSFVFRLVLGTVLG